MVDIGLPYSSFVETIKDYFNVPNMRSRININDVYNFFRSDYV